MEPREFANALANGNRLMREREERKKATSILVELLERDLGEETKRHIREAIAILDRQI